MDLFKFEREGGGGRRAAVLTWYNFHYEQTNLYIYAHLSQLKVTVRKIIKFYFKPIS